MAKTEEELQAQSLEAELEAATESALAEDAAKPKAEATPQPLEEREPPKQETRILVTAGMTVAAAAIMLGGIFVGPTPRIYAMLAGIAGLYVARQASRARGMLALYAWVVGGIFLTGLILVIPSGFDNLPNLAKELREAAGQGDLLRPPVNFTPGWQAILGWVMACVGFAAGWIALEMDRPAFGLLVPLPVVAFGAISVPKDQQLASGLVALVLVAVGLGLLSSLHERGADDETPGAAYELRRAMRAIPLIAGVTILLFFLSKSNLLFPPPLYDPTENARKPKTIPLSEVQDRVLFEVEAEFSGPWKMGTLDVYQEPDWKLPPFNEDVLGEIDPETGELQTDLEPDVIAVFTVRGLTGAILPSLANSAAIHAELPRDTELSFDERQGIVRITQGQINAGLRYALGAGGIPDLDQLRNAERTIPDEAKPYLDLPAPPAAVQALLSQAPDDNLWDRLDFVRQKLIRNVVASGQGIPVGITPARVGEMLTTTPESTPFEIVAAQAMLARWAGIPARIGYGFDKGDEGPEESTLLVRPKHGALWIEVYFNGFGWLPIIGDPIQAKINLSDAPQQFDPSLGASQDVAINLIIPELESPAGELFRAIRRILGAVTPVAAGVGLIYLLWPFPYKAVRRARRRTWAMRHGPSARVALAYAEWRDAVTDYGYTYRTDPPMMFLTRFAPDEDHAELAWLVTRVLWGDLRDDASVDDAVAAEELSAALRLRLGRAHPWTLRTVAALSRLSIRNPYAPEIEISAGARRSEVAHASV